MKMKKIYIIFIVSTILLSFASCESYNERNFPGYEDAAKPANVANYTYELATADYASIAKAALALAENAEDSAKASSISSNKYFTEEVLFDEYIPLLLNTKYIYCDAGSSAMITFNLLQPYDTTTISSSNKYELTTEDYDAMGTASGQPGQSDDFSSSINPYHYIPIWLAQTYPYATEGSVKMINYKYYASGASTNKKDVFVFENGKWNVYTGIVSEEAKFSYLEKEWKYIDSEILFDLFEGIGGFTAVNVTGDQVWAWDSYNYMKMTGYVSGSYYDNEDWLISPAMDFSQRATPWVTFDHVGRYFAEMKEEISIWATTKYTDDASIVEEDWIQLEIPEEGYPSGSNWTFISSTPISLEQLAGETNVRIAFKYYSNSENNAAGTWEVKNVLVYEE